MTPQPLPPTEADRRRQHLYLIRREVAPSQRRPFEELAWCLQRYPHECLQRLADLDPLLRPDFATSALRHVLDIRRAQDELANMGRLLEAELDTVCPRPRAEPTGQKG